MSFSPWQVLRLLGYPYYLPAQRILHDLWSSKISIASARSFRQGSTQSSCRSSDSILHTGAALFRLSNGRGRYLFSAKISEWAGPTGSSWQQGQAVPFLSALLGYSSSLLTTFLKTSVRYGMGVPFT